MEPDANGGGFSLGKAILWLVVLVLIVGGFILYGSRSGATKKVEPIKIGFIGALTGAASQIGQGGLAAVQTAVDELNAAGGVNGRMLSVVAQDDLCTPESAMSATAALVDTEKVSAIVSSACPSSLRTLASSTAVAQIPVVAVCPDDSQAALVNDYTFSVGSSSTTTATQLTEACGASVHAAAAAIGGALKESPADGAALKDGLARLLGGIPVDSAVKTMKDGNKEEVKK